MEVIGNTEELQRLAKEARQGADDKNGNKPQGER